jgi:hypothetical protein
METKYKIHASYIFFILIAVIIGLITVKWSGIPDLANLITFALTVTSLVLAVLAIGYSVYSNTSFTQNISTMTTAAQDVSKTATELSNMTGALSQKVEVIPSRIELLEGKMSERFDLMLLEGGLKKSGQVENIESADAKGHDPQKIEDAVPIKYSTFLEKSSYAGLLTLYCCIKAYKTKKAFNLKDYFKTIDWGDDSFYAGLLGALRSVGVIDFTVNEGIYNVTFIDERFNKPTIVDFVKQGIKNEKDEAMKALITKGFDGTDIYFK